MIHFLPLKGMPQKEVQGDMQQGACGHRLLCPECAEQRFGAIVQAVAIPGKQGVQRRDGNRLQLFQGGG